MKLRATTLQRPTPRPHGRVCAALAALAAILAVTALHAAPDDGSPPAAAAPAAAAPGASAAPALPAGPARDIVLDQPAGKASGGGKAGTAGAAPTGALVPSLPSVPSMPSLGPLEVAVGAAALGDLGLALLRLDAAPAAANAVVSPLSVASAMGLVHAGAAGATRRELAQLLSSGPAADQGFGRQLPGLLRLLAGPDGAPAALQMANRLWVHTAAAAGVPEAYRQTIAAGYGSDLAVLDFANAPAAVEAINGWARERTAGRIPSIVSTDTVTPRTRAVLTNAVYFKQPWARPFDPAATQPRPFAVPGGSQPVPTMSAQRSVAVAERADGVTAFELPFEGEQVSLLIVMPPPKVPLGDLLKHIGGAELLALAGDARPRDCLLQLPRLSLRREAGSLRKTLQALGVQRAFAQDADFGPMLGGRQARDLSLSDVLHAATFVIDEAGGEAAAATAAVVGVRSAVPAARPQTCAVDRPFLYVLRHRATGAPLFVGRVADPRRP